MSDYVRLAREIVEHLDSWVNVLAAPLRPLREVHEPDGGVRLEFRERTPQTLLVGKAIRAVSGLRAAILLADLGYCAESAALLRTVSDFCAEIMAVAETLPVELPGADFVARGRLEDGLNVRTRNPRQKPSGHACVPSESGNTECNASKASRIFCPVSVNAP